MTIRRTYPVGLGRPEMWPHRTYALVSASWTASSAAARSPLQMRYASRAKVVPRLLANFSKSGRFIS